MVGTPDMNQGAVGTAHWASWTSEFLSMSDAPAEKTAPLQLLGQISCPRDLSPALDLAKTEARVKHG